MEKFNLEQFTEDFIEGIVRPLNAAVDDSKKAKEAAARHFRDCTEEYGKDLDARKEGLQKKAAVIDQELEALAQKNMAALDQLSAALSAGDAAAESTAQKEIDAIAAEEFVARKRLEAMHKVKVHGSDTLYEAALQAFADFLAARIKHKKQMEVVGGIAKLLIPLLEDIQNMASIGSEGSIAYGADLRSAGRRIWKIIEQHNGPIDFRSNTAGDIDEDARVRFAQSLALKKIDAAFEGHPAGEQLKQCIRNRLLIACTSADNAQSTSTAG